MSNAMRRAGRLERFFIVRYYLGLDSCVIVAAQYTNAHGARALTKGTLYPALAQTIRSHAELFVHIENERTSKAAFARLPTIDLNKVVRFVHEDASAVESIIQAEFMRPILNSQNLPLWRISVTSDNFVLFSWHHVIGDGRSGLAFHRALLEALNSPSPRDGDNEPHIDVVQTPTDLAMTEPLERLANDSVSFKTFVRDISREFLPLSLFQKPTWTGNKVPNTTATEMKTHIRTMSIPPSDAARLLSVSRKHAATLTATLYTLTTAAFSSLIVESNSERKSKRRKFARISVVVPVSLRHITGTPATAMGNIVSSVRTVEDRLVAVSDFSWDKAAAYSKKLHESIPKTTEAVAMLKFLFGRYGPFFEGKLGNSRDTSFEISNLGAFNTGGTSGTGHEGWAVGKVYFAQDDSIIGAAMALSVVGDPTGAVNIVFSWADGSISVDFATRVIARVSKGLSDLLEEQTA